MNSTIRKILPWTFLTGVYGVTSYSLANDIKETNKKTKHAKEIIHKYNPDKYEQLKKNTARVKVWYEEAKHIQDSLKMESAAKVSYAKGIMAVQDSLKSIKR